MVGPSISLTLSTRTSFLAFVAIPTGAAHAAREGDDDDLSLRQLLPSDRGPQAETAGEDDQELLTGMW